MSTVGSRSLLTALVTGAASGARVRFPDGEVTFDGLLERAASVRLPEGAARVALLATPTLDTLATMVAALEAGVSLVPVPADVGAAELEHVIADSGAVPIGALAERGGAPSRPATAPAAAGDALVLYTSGTTGRPKGVLHPVATMAACLDGLADAWAWTPDDTLVHGLPLNHVHGLVLGVFGALRVGSSLVHTGRPAPDAYAAASGSLYFGVPTVWARIAREPDAARALRSARLLISGSAALPEPVWTRLHELTGHAVRERYGMSETLITLAARADAPSRVGWVGTPIAGVASRLVDESGSPVPADGATLGRLEIAGPTVCSGYLGRPEADAASRTADGWFRTGDIAVVAPDGWHRIVGRESIDLIKTGGYRVGAGEIEAELLAHPRVVEAAVIGVPDDDLGQRVEAFVVVGDGGVAADQLIAWVADRLSVHKRPRAVHLVEALPRNEMGKVQKQHLGTG